MPELFVTLVYCVGLAAITCAVVGSIRFWLRLKHYRERGRISYGGRPDLLRGQYGIDDGVDDEK